MRIILHLMLVLVHLNLHTFTPRQLLIRTRNRSAVCSQNPRESNSKATQSKVISKRKANTGGAEVSKQRPNFTGAEVEVLLQIADVSILFHYDNIHLSLVLIYLFTDICSVRVVLLFMFGHRCLVEWWLYKCETYLFMIQIFSYLICIIIIII